jgi:GntR family carbon starvation induced transcriptional regulator
MVDAAYRRLRDDIIGGRFNAGEKLRVEHLRAEYDVGTTPLREALSKLTAERLVHSIGHRGFRVAPMSLAELEDITEMRVLLETRAVEESVRRGDVDWEGRLAAAHHLLCRFDEALRGVSPPSTAEWERKNADFHEALVSACESPWLLSLRGLLYDQHRRYRFLAIREMPSHTRDVASEHRQIFDAALARNIRHAVDLSAVHIRQTAQQLRGSLAQRLT